MSATSLIAEAQAAGVHLSLLGRDRITWACETDPPPGLIDRIRAAKGAVLAALEVEEAKHWRTFFEERAAIREYDGGLTRPDAEAGALQDAIAHWLARNPLSPGVPEDGCIHCAGALPVDYRVAVLAGSGHAWLHPTCMPEMNEARLALARREVHRLLGLSEAAV